MVEQLVRALPEAGDADDLYAESAAAFLATHLPTRGRGERLPGPEHAAVRAGIAVMRDRLAEPLAPADIAAEVHLSVYHFIRVFRAATGETPHRFLTRLRVDLTPTSDGGTVIHWHGTCSARWGMGKLMKGVMQRVTQEMADGLASHAAALSRRDSAG
ncbi:AraC family transcriptional regulator [Actinosynnema sp. CS-041913]|uniref:AraC family transcriptional regulator n=1 Tax=Actinosynnema sp. CS-041913 TaxID=3239917 RepID=UPI003D8F3E7F